MAIPALVFLLFLVFLVIIRFLKPQGFADMQPIVIRLRTDIYDHIYDITHRSTISDF